MIIHTSKIIKNLGIKYITENKKIENILKGEEKIKILLSENKLSTNEICSKTNLASRTVRKCLLKLEKKKEVKRIKGKKINNKVRYSDFWVLKSKKPIKTVPLNQILAHYRKEHHNHGYRQHYMFLPKNIILKDEFLSAIGFFDAEGTKTIHKLIEVVNSEPLLINLFIKFLDYFNIKKENISYRIIFNNKLPFLLKKSKEKITKNAIKFWTTQINIPKTKKIKSSYVGKSKGKARTNWIKYGSLAINYNSVLFRKILFALIEETKKQIIKKGEAIAYLRGYFAGEAYVGKKDRQMQIGSNDLNQLILSRKLLKQLNIDSAISPKNSTSTNRLLISKLNSFIILEQKDFFKFHRDKQRDLIKKILNYKNLEKNLRIKLEKKLKK